MSITFRRKALAVTSASALVLGASAFHASSATAEEVGPDSELSTVFGVDNPDKIDGEYIVQLNSELSTLNVDSFAGSFDGTVVQEWDFFDAFSVHMDHSDAQALAGHPDVKAVSHNSQVDINVGPGEQEDAPWNLDRIDQRSGMDGVYSYPNTGFEVPVYVLDTGINTTHVEFEGRVGEGYDAIDDGGIEDCQGHGTAMSGVIGSTEYGVAKDVTIHPVRILDCQGSGTYDGIIDGIEWVVNHSDGVAIANGSFGGPFSAALNDAVDAAAEAGVFFVTSSGSSGDDACNYSPPSAEGAFVFSATDMSDNISENNNHGPCVDMWAPGVDITVPGIDGDDSIMTLSGSSLAAAHGSGAAALVLRDNPDFGPGEIGDWLIENATQLDGPNGPFPFLYVWED